METRRLPLRERNSFTRDDGTPLNYTLVNIKDWCKNTFEVVNQLRINTDYSHHRYDVMLLINGVPAVQIELKTLGISPRRAMQQIVDYKNDPGNGYTRTLLCFVQLFVVSNRTDTWYFTNYNAGEGRAEPLTPDPSPLRGERGVKGSRRRYDRPKPKTTRENPLEHRRRPARVDECR